MKTIIHDRDSGKAAELLKYARTHGAAVITQNKRAFAVKAAALGFENIDILDYDDLKYESYDHHRPVVIHNADKMLYWLICKDYGLETIGFTATVEE
jgi:hypothetical protein